MATPADGAREALLTELDRLRAELAWLRSLPAGAVTVEGLVVELSETHPDERTTIRTAWVRATDRTWRVEQTDFDGDTEHWRKHIRITRQPDDPA